MSKSSILGRHFVSQNINIDPLERIKFGYAGQYHLRQRMVDAKSKPSAAADGTGLFSSQSHNTKPHYMCS
jgi:hypothetical protein